MKLSFYIKRLIKHIIYVLKIDKFREFNSFPSNNNSPLTLNAVNDLNICCTIIESLSLNYRLSDGTALGLFRDGGLIPHDNDIDIDIIFSPEIDENELVKSFYKNGYKLARKVYYGGSLQQLAFFNKTTFDIFDMVFWYKKGDQIYNYCERNFERKQDAKYFEKLSEINFKGKKYPLPSQTKNWLEMRYGNDWNIPKKSKGDWKEECFDMKQKLM
jgi:phosphorylcholine metabolism protein LicD